MTLNIRLSKLSCEGAGSIYNCMCKWKKLRCRKKMLEEFKLAFKVTKKENKLLKILNACSFH